MDLNEAKTEGYYPVRFLIPHHEDSRKRPLQNCRYWPKVHLIRRNGTMGAITPIRPGRVQKVLDTKGDQYRVFESIVNLKNKPSQDPSILEHHEHTTTKPAE